MLRAFAFALVLVVGVALVYGLGELARPTALVRTPEQVEGPFRGEIALATAHGLSVDTESVLREEAWRREFTVQPGECVAVVAVNEGASPVSASLAVPGSQLGTVAPIVHLAACASAEGAVTVSLARTLASFDTGERMHLAVLRGRVTEPRTYTRLSLDGLQRAAIDEQNVRARVAALGARLGEERTADLVHLALLTTTRSSFAAPRALAGRMGRVPGVLPTPAAPDPFASPDDETTPPRVFVENGQARALAVVDTGALGAPCVEIVLARLDDPTTPIAVRRVSVPELRVDPVAATDPAIARDRVCPATGLFVYVTDSSVSETFAVSAVSVDDESAPPPVPSDFALATLGRHPSSGLTILPVGMVATTRAECAAGSPDGCLALASLAQQGIEGAGTVREALEPLCRASGGTVCDVLAGAIAEADASGADEAERRACTTGASQACMRRGARYLTGASDLGQAYRTFRYGCAHACTDCCTAATQMRDWQLAPPSATEDPDEPG